jgi:hypothetical protein
MKTYKIIFAALTVSVFTLCCSDERIEPKQEKTEFESADDYLDSKKAEEQEYEISEEGEGPLTTKKGTKIWLSKSLLMYPNGDSVHFPYTIKVVELFTPADMIYYQMPSMAGSSLLTTHGEIRIRAFKNDEELVLRPGKKWQLEIPKASTINDMLLYYGTTSNNKTDWQDKHQDSFTITGSGYQTLAQELGWLSCAKDAIGMQESIEYTFYSDSISLGNVNTFVYMPAQEGLMQVFNNTTDPLPLGETMKIISIARQGEQLFSFYRQDVVSEDNRVEIILQKTTEAELTSLLNNLSSM